MDYTICKNVIKNAKDGNRIMYDLLMAFVTTQNTHRVIHNEKIMEAYAQYNTEFIRTWINLMVNSENFKYIANVEENIFLKTCLKSHDKRLIVKEKEDYQEQEYVKINVLDTGEAIDEIKIPKNTIIQHGTGNIASTGNNSQNIKKTIWE